jgi:stage II sporulation protein AA (anti-sigma F factor antagonist)
MEIFESRSDDTVVVHLAGRVNSSHAPELAAYLQRLLNGGSNVIVVDLERLDHMTSAGLRCLLRIEKQAHDAGGRFVLCGLHGLTRELFEVGGFLDMFAIARTREEAVRQAAAAPGPG